MRLLNSSVGAFAITSLGAQFAIASLLYWGMHFTMLCSCSSGAVIRSSGCYDSITVITLFNDRCNAEDLSHMASKCQESAL